MRTAVALGSNIGDRLENLRAARNSILDLPNVKAPILSSAVYETEPVGCEPGAGKFLNAIVEFEYDGDLARLLEQLIQIEEALGRRRDHPQNVSRIIDVDLLYCGEQRINDKQLQLPHPRLHLREFVLRPLADIGPDLLLPGQKKSIRELLAEVEQSGEVIRFAQKLVSRENFKKRHEDAGEQSKALRAKFCESLLSFRGSFGSAGRPRTAFGRGLRSEMGG